MNRNNNANSKNLPVYGNVLESFKGLADLIPQNDGTRSFIILSSEAHHLSLPISGPNQETIIDLTDQNHDVSQINDSILIVETSSQIRIAELSGTAYGGEDPLIFIGFKASNQCIRQMRVLINGQNTEYLSTECLREGFAYSNLKGRAEKASKKHVHTLYEDVAEYKLGICGVYLPLSLWKNSQRTATVNIRCIIPLSDLLPLQSFSIYPSKIIGDLALKLAFTMNGLIWCQVDPVAVNDADNYLNNTAHPLDAKFGSTAFYDRFFHQIGDYGTLLDEDGSASYIARRCAPQVMSFSINRLSCQKMGYGVLPQTLDAMASFISSNPIIIPAQELVYHAFAKEASSSGFVATLTILFDNIEAISIMFPTSSQQVSCFKNPNVRDLQMKIENTLYPPTPISTNSEISPEFLNFQLNASDLDGSIEPTRGWIYSLVNQRLNSSGVRYANTRIDDTDFMCNFSLERSQGGHVFDGFSTSKPVNVELRFSPVTMGANDVYYLPDPTDPSVHPPAPELWLCKDTYWVMQRGGLSYVNVGSPR